MGNTLVLNIFVEYALNQRINLNENKWVNLADCYRAKPEDMDPIWEIAEDIETDLYIMQDNLDKLIDLIKPINNGRYKLFSS